MRARFAYISSLGTTAILVAAALLMLAVVSAIVAFRGWPGGSGDGGQVQSVPLAPGGAAQRVALVRRGAGIARGVERSARASRVAAPRASTAGLVKTAATGPRTVPGLVMVPVASAPMTPQPTHSGQAGQPQPVADPVPQRSLPDQPPPGGPLPGGGGGLPAPGPLPAPAASQPTPEQVTAMVGTVLGGSTPPPPLLTGGVERVTSSVVSSALHVR
jgi:hypothetical protein